MLILRATFCLGKRGKENISICFYLHIETLRIYGKRSYLFGVGCTKWEKDFSVIALSD